MLNDYLLYFIIIVIEIFYYKVDILMGLEEFEILSSDFVNYFEI